MIEKGQVKQYAREIHNVSPLSMKVKYITGQKVAKCLQKELADTIRAAGYSLPTNALIYEKRGDDSGWILHSTGGDKRDRSSQKGAKPLDTIHSILAWCEFCDPSVDPYTVIFFVAK